MAYQQHSLQQPLPGIESGFSQTGQGVPHQGQLQQLPGASTQAIGQPVIGQARTAPQQTETTPQQMGQYPQQAFGPQTTQRQSSPQLPQQTQQLSPQSQQLPPQAQHAPVSPAQQFGQPRGPVWSSGTPQSLSAGSMQPQAQIPQSFGQQAVAQQPQGQWGMQGSGQPVSVQTTPPSQSPMSGQQSQMPMSGQQSQMTAQSLPSQTAELQAGAVQQTGEQTRQGVAGTPSIDIVDTPDEIVLFVDLPGYDEENIRIQADGQNLTISAERRDEERGEGRTFAQERPQKLQRTVRLPTRADVNEANATYENGVCKISLPKTEDEKQHEIAFQ